MAVLDPFKRFADRVIRPHLFPLYFLLELGYVGRRNRKLVEEFTRDRQFDPIWDLDFSKYKSSDTIVLLGSGSSINEITDEQWELIEQSDSLGFNYWPIHEHDPTYYVFELPRDERDHREKMYQLLEYRADDYAGKPIILKDLRRTSDELDLDRIPEELAENMYASGKVSIPWNPEDPSSFDRSLSYLDRLGYFDERDRVEVNFQKRGSLTYHVLLATMLGYDNIVLLGVDLVDYKYFYIERQDHYRERGAPIPTLDHLEGQHGTMDEEMGRLPIDSVLYSIRDVVLEPRDVQMYIGTKRSALYPELPYYFDEES